MKETPQVRMTRHIASALCEMDIARRCAFEAGDEEMVELCRTQIAAINRVYFAAYGDARMGMKEQIWLAQ